MSRMTVNERPVEFDLDPRMPLLYALREAMNLTGTKACGGGAECGANMVRRGSRKREAKIGYSLMACGRSALAWPVLSCENGLVLDLDWGFLLVTSHRHTVYDTIAPCSVLGIDLYIPA